MRLKFAENLCTPCCWRTNCPPKWQTGSYVQFYDVTCNGSIVDLEEHEDSVE